MAGYNSLWHWIGVNIMLVIYMARSARVWVVAAPVPVHQHMKTPKFSQLQDLCLTRFLSNKSVPYLLPPHGFASSQFSA